MTADEALKEMRSKVLSVPVLLAEGYPEAHPKQLEWADAVAPELAALREKVRTLEDCECPDCGTVRPVKVRVDCDCMARRSLP